MSYVQRRQLLTGIAAAGLFSVSYPAMSATEAPYTWASVPFGGGGYVDGFVYHPSEKGILYARTDVGGLYRYDYANKSWIQLLDHLSYEDADYMGVLAIALDPQDPNKIYAACGLYLQDWAKLGAILRSNDMGKTWQKCDLPIRIGGNADGRGSGERLAVHPKDGNIIYYASNQDGLWKSVDGGKSFSKSAASPAKSNSMMFIDPQTHDIYVGSSTDKGGLFISKDDGQSFSRITETPEQVPQRAAVDRKGNLYVTFAQGDYTLPANPSYAVRGGLWKRAAGATAWENISPIITDEHHLFGYSGIDISADGTVVVSTLDRWWPHDDIFASKDGGKTWTPFSPQSKFTTDAYPWLAETNKDRKMGGWLSDLKINPFDANEMIYGHGGGIWISRNLTAIGSSDPLIFDAALANVEEGVIKQLASTTGDAIILAASGDMSGAAWFDLTKSPDVGLFRPNTESNFSVDYAGQKPNYVARTVANSGTRGFYSLDSGATWQLFEGSAYKPPVKDGDWRGPGFIAVSAKATSLLWIPEKESAYYSHDNGKTWTPSEGLPPYKDQPFIPLSDKVVDGVFYIFDREGGRIFITVDAGKSFKPIANGLPTLASYERAQLAIPHTRMRDLWLALPTGLVHSRDSGTPFASIKGVDAAWAVGFGAPATKDGYPSVFLYGKVKGKGGVWRSNDEGKTWVRVNDDAHQFGNIQHITGDPVEYGPVYIAAHGRGILVGRPSS